MYVIILFHYKLININYFYIIYYYMNKLFFLIIISIIIYFIYYNCNKTYTNKKNKHKKNKINGGNISNKSNTLESNTIESLDSGTLDISDTLNKTNFIEEQEIKVNNNVKEVKKLNKMKNTIINNINSWKQYLKSLKSEYIDNKGPMISKFIKSFEKSFENNSTNKDKNKLLYLFDKYEILIREIDTNKHRLKYYNKLYDFIINKNYYPTKDELIILYDNKSIKTTSNNNNNNNNNILNNKLNLLEKKLNKLQDYIVEEEGLENNIYNNKKNIELNNKILKKKN